MDLRQPALAVRNYVSDAGVAITAAQEAADYQASNLARPNYTQRWRSTAVSGPVQIDIDLGASRSDVDLIIVFGLNLEDTGLWSLAAGTDPTFTTNILSTSPAAAFDTTLAAASGVVDSPPWGRPAVYVLEAGVSIRYLQITLQDDGNADGYLEAAYVYAGPALQVGRASSWRPSVYWVGEPGTAAARLEHALTISHASETARRKVQSLGRGLLGSGRFGVVPHPGRPSSWPHEVILARLVEPPEEVALSGLVWNLTLTLEEVTD